MNGNPGFHHKAFGGTTVTASSDGCLVLPNEALLGIEGIIPTVRSFDLCLAADGVGRISAAPSAAGQCRPLTGGAVPSCVRGTPQQVRTFDGWPQSGTSSSDRGSTGSAPLVRRRQSASTG